jgi:hypothetical protein
MKFASALNPPLVQDAYPMARLGDDDYKAQLAHHDAQLGGLTTRMGQVETTLRGHGSLLSEIRDAVTAQKAKPAFDPRTTIGIIKDTGVVFAMVCAGILYLAAQNGSRDLVLLQEREAQANKRLEKMESLVLPQSWAAVTKP